MRPIHTGPTGPKTTTTYTGTVKMKTFTDSHNKKWVQINNEIPDDPYALNPEWETHPVVEVALDLYCKGSKLEDVCVELYQRTNAKTMYHVIIYGSYDSDENEQVDYILKSVEFEIRWSGSTITYKNLPQNEWWPTGDITIDW